MTKVMIAAVVAAVVIIGVVGAGSAGNTVVVASAPSVDSDAAPRVVVANHPAVKAATVVDARTASEPVRPDTPVPPGTIVFDDPDLDGFFDDERVFVTPPSAPYFHPYGSGMADENGPRSEDQRDLFFPRPDSDLPGVPRSWTVGPGKGFISGERVFGFPQVSPPAPPATGTLPQLPGLRSNGSVWTLPEGDLHGEPRRDGRSHLRPPDVPRRVERGRK